MKKDLEKETSYLNENQKSFSLCPICESLKKCYNELKRWVEYAEELAMTDLEPACLSDSGVFHLELAYDRKESVRDSLDVGEQIACCALDDIGFRYSVPSSDPLRDLGIHLTTNPGFGYSEQQ